MSSEWVAMINDLPDIHTSETADAGKYSYKYASLPSILEAVKPVLAKHGWCVTQNVTTSDSGHPQVSTLFTHVEAEARGYGPLSVPASGSGAQAVGSAITYARRYALVAALGLAPDTDDDGAAASRPVVADTPKDRAWRTVFEHNPDTANDRWWAALDDLGIKPEDINSDLIADSVIVEANDMTEGYGS